MKSLSFHLSVMFDPDLNNELILDMIVTKLLSTRVSKPDLFIHRGYIKIIQMYLYEK